MARPKSPVPTEPLNLRLPVNLFARLSTSLMDEFSLKVPRGAYQEFFVDRLNEYFSRTPVWTPWGQVHITGSPEAIAQIQKHFKKGT